MINFRSPAATGYALALGASILWSTIFLFARGVAGSMSPVEMAFWRWALAFLAILPFTWRELKAQRALLRKHFPLLALAGVIGFSGYSLLLFQAGKSTEAANLALLSASAPIFMALLSRFWLGERVGTRQVFGLLIAVSGVIFLILRGDINRLLTLTFSSGDLWMLLAAVMFASYSVIIRRRPAGMGQGAFLAAMLGCSTLSMAPLMLWEAAATTYHLPSARLMGILAFIAIAPSLIGYLLWNKAVERIGAARAGVIYYTVPLFSSLEAAWLLNERAGTPQVVGGALIIGGILFSSLDALRRSGKERALQRKTTPPHMPTENIAQDKINPKN